MEILTGREREREAWRHRGERLEKKMRRSREERKECHRNRTVKIRGLCKD